ncbi:MAG: hypothetical protein Q9M19_06110 [Mariprofundaceae bacterium]|nr:hypothetical protein [Mariprofundaceae bacterium]
MPLLNPVLKALFNRQRIAICAMLVFAFQVLVVGLCVPLASAQDGHVMKVANMDSSHVTSNHVPSNHIISSKSESPHTVANAMPTDQMAAHCLASSSMANMQHDSDDHAAHACSHCDLPDLVVKVHVDHSVFAHADQCVVLPHAALFSASALTLTYDVNFSPQRQTSLLSYNLNLRFRV